MEDCAPALSAIDDGNQACILLDLGLQRLHRIEVLRRVRQGGDKTPLPMLTASDVLGQRVDGLNLSGRSGYEDRLGAGLTRRSGDAASHRFRNADPRCCWLSYPDDHLPSDLSAFLAVVRCGSVSREADALGIMQPSVSKAIRRMAQFAGVPLLEPGIHGARLTADSDLP